VIERVSQTDISVRDLPPSGESTMTGNDTVEAARTTSSVSPVEVTTDGGTSDLIVYVDRSTVCEGALADLKAGMADLVAFVEANEPRILSYAVYFSPDGDRMTVIHEHPDPASLAFHLEIGGPEFAKVGPFLDLETIDVYGRPGEAVLGQLREKAETLGRGRVSVHDLHRGFERVSGD